MFDGRSTCAPLSDARSIQWLRPQQWRRHVLGGEPYWVEDEVVVVADDAIVHTLSWSEPLDDSTRREYELALTQWLALERSIAN